jgi:hypothetical protein
MHFQKVHRLAALDFGQPDVYGVSSRRVERVLAQVEWARLEVGLEYPSHGHEYDIPK